MELFSIRIQRTFQLVSTTRFSLETPCGLILYVGGEKLLPIAVFLKCYAKIAKFSELRAMIA